MITIRGHEKKIAILSFLLAIGLAAAGYFASSAYIGGLLANIASTFLGLSIGLYIVNIYLDRESKRAAVTSLLKLIAPSIQGHHNALLHEAWNRFGKPQWGEIIGRYTENGGDPRALTPEERQKIYDMVKAGKVKYDSTFTTLEAELKELALILGWSFDPGILSASFNCRYAITKLRAATFDDSEEAKLEVCEHFLDTEFTSSLVFHGLVELLGLDKKAIYSDA